MNKIILYTLFVLLFVSSCTRGFEDINTNPNSVDNPNPDFVFSKSQLDGLNNNYFYTSILQCGQMMQHYASYKEASGVGDKYLDNEVYYSSYFSQAYPNAINQITLVINKLKDDPKNSNKLNTARIWKSISVSSYYRFVWRYSLYKCCKSVTDKIFLPEYDSQELIYKDMLKELEAAAGALDASKTGFGKADLIYDDGPNDFNRNPSALDPIRWDFSRGSNGRTNNEGGKFSKTFIDFLKSTSDPRLSVYSGVWQGSVQNTIPAVQKGFPKEINCSTQAYGTSNLLRT
ncbi:hypothetical protein FQR65_LT17928 [Abscondita terminalis]|nr:hypothetical protein FQR65_LT17928 [Abscondita terminalis]